MGPDGPHAWVLGIAPPLPTIVRYCSPLTSRVKRSWNENQTKFFQNHKEPGQPAWLPTRRRLAEDQDAGASSDGFATRVDGSQGASKAGIRSSRHATFASPEGRVGWRANVARASNVNHVAIANAEIGAEVCKRYRFTPSMLAAMPSAFHPPHTWSP